LSPTPRHIGVLANSSPLAGLHRRRLSFTEVLAQSVAAVAPTAAAVSLPAIVIALVGRSAVLVFVAATAIVALVAYCMTQFARRLASASGIYSYTAKALGPYGAFTAGWSSVIGYAGAAMSSALGAGIYLSAVAQRLQILHSSTASSVAVSAVLTAGVAGVLMIRGIRLSARVSVTLELVSVALVLVVLGLLVASSSGTGAVEANPPGASFSSGSLSVLLAVVCFVGFESAGTLGVEARRPFDAVPRTLFWSPAVLGALFVFAAWAQTVIFSDGSAHFLNSLIPVANLAQAHGRAVLGGFLDLAIFFSWFACLMGSTNALVRVLFSMAREGVLPPAVGRTHRRYGTPYVLIVIALILMTGFAIERVVRGAPTASVFRDLLTLSAFGYMLSYGLLCAATPVFLRKLDELTRGPLVAGVVACVVTVFLVCWTLATRASDTGGVAAVYVALMALGWLRLLYVRWRDPARLSNVGVYDEPIVNDVLDTAEAWPR
jgi:amino acid transporter